MNILRVPKEVFEGHVFPRLHHNDILRIRRVCKHTKGVSDDFLRLTSRQGLRLIEIDEDLRSFRRLLDLGFSVCSLHIKNTDAHIFGSDYAREFLEKHAQRITELSIDKFECCLTSEEFGFYNSLPNLKKLHICTLSLMNVRKQDTLRFPATFENLLELKVDRLVSPIMYPDNHRHLSYLSKLYQFCVNVDHFKHPKFIWKRALADEHSEIEYCNHRFLRKICDLITKRHATDCKLKTYDLEEFRSIDSAGEDDAEAGEQFLQLHSACLRYGVQLENVDTTFLLYWDYDHARDTIIEEIEELLSPFKSFTNLHWLTFWGESPNIEKIRINSTAKCSVAEVLNCHPDWPLRSLSLVIDSWKLQPPHLAEMMASPEETDKLLEFLFEEDKREMLEELRVEFDPCVENEYSHLKKFERRHRYPRLRLAWIIENCPNLTILELKNWPGTNRELLKLFEHFINLKEVSFDACQDVGNRTFVGMDPKAPVFLRMKCLKKLALKNLDEMPKITDLVFELVFRHLKLTHFTLESSSPIASVTVQGIRSLLTGDFAKSIEKFPFHTWSLVNVPANGFKKLETQFRSYQMI